MKAKKVKIKTRPGITDEVIHNYLIHHALIENYFISGTPKLNDGTIYCLSYKNAIMIFMIEDSEFNARCINYLEKNGIPVFEDYSEAKEYGKLLLEKASSKQ